MKLEKKYLEDIYKMKQIRADQIVDKESPPTIKNTEDIMESKNFKDLTKSRMRESEFEKQMIKNKQQRDKEIKACQEGYFIKLIACIVFATTTFGVFAFIYVDTVFNYMPVFRSLACRKT